MNKKTIECVPVAGRRVLMRVDFNVPIDARLRIANDRRIRVTVPSIRSVLGRGGRLILMSHLGRPSTPDEWAKYSLRPVAECLKEMLEQEVHFASGVIGNLVQDAVDKLQNGGVLLLENLRFHPGESKGDAEFATALAALGEIYCNDAFGACHRHDASLVALPRSMSTRPKVAGLLLAKELQVLSGLLTAANRPFVAVLGGAKASDKIKTIKRLVELCDRVLIGGAMANTFALAQGGRIGSSIAEPGQLQVAREILEQVGPKVTLPIDVVCAVSLRPNVATQRVAFGQVPEGMAAYDIGPLTVERYVQEIKTAGTIFWNGPVGAYEVPPFDAGTYAIARAISMAAARSVVGGGDTAAALERFGLADRVFHVSTGGGASLAFLAGESLPALEVLDEA